MTKSKSVLIGAGFSAPMGYPIGNKLNDLLSCTGDDFAFHTSGKLTVSADGKKPNFGYKTSYDISFDFCVALIKFFRERKGFCASTHANAICAGVAFFFFANSAILSTTTSLAFRFSSVNRGTTFLKSVLSNFVFSFIAPVRNPFPSGLNGANPIPNHWYGETAHSQHV